MTVRTISWESTARPVRSGRGSSFVRATPPPPSSRSPRELDVAPLVVGRPGLDWLTENADGGASQELSHRSSVPLAVIPGIH
jgi:hypothetical protein